MTNKKLLFQQLYDYLYITNLRNVEWESSSLLKYQLLLNSSRVSVDSCTELVWEELIACNHGNQFH